jgi:hypothetical protein
MADAIYTAPRIDPERCRAAARGRFPLERTVERYFALYRELASCGWAETSSAERAPRPSTAADAFFGD